MKSLRFHWRNLARHGIEAEEIKECLLNHHFCFGIREEAGMSIKSLAELMLANSSNLFTRIEKIIGSSSTPCLPDRRMLNCTDAK